MHVCVVRRISEIVPSSYIVNLPASESQQALLSATEKMTAASSQQQSSSSKRSRQTDDDVNDDDTDVITQAMRDLTYAYNQSSEYLMREREEAQCVMQ